MKKIFAEAFSAILLVSAAVSCTDQFDDVELTGSLTGSVATQMVENDPTFLESYVSGLYSWLVQYGNYNYSGHDNFGEKGINYISDIMGRDIVLASQHWGQYDYLHDYWAEQYVRPRQIWGNYYTLINNANAIIDFFGEEDPSNETLRSYLGQSYALRAFGYMNLILFFQDICTTGGEFNSTAPAVPIVYATRDGKTAEEAAEKQGRNTIADIQVEIEENLDKAINLLSSAAGRSAKNEVDLGVAYGIAARYYLMSQQWSKAKDAANKARQGYVLSKPERGYNDVSDQEVMWGFDHNSETQTTYASFGSQMSNDSPGYAGLNYCAKLIDRQLYESIPNSDYRKALFNGPDGDEGAANPGAQQPYAARKFGWLAGWLADYLYMRAAEMYLIEAEAAVRSGDSSTANSVMAQYIATRDPGNTTTNWTVDNILLQRRIELWGDGLTYYDIRRNGIGADRTYEGTNHPVWGRYNWVAHTGYWIFQIPRTEYQNNPYISEEDQNKVD